MKSGQNHRWNAPERYKNPDEVELFPIGDGLLMFIKSNVFVMFVVN